jgi:hypothetical protein
MEFTIAKKLEALVFPKFDESLDFDHMDYKTILEVVVKYT